MYKENPLSNAVAETELNVCLTLWQIIFVLSKLCIRNGDVSAVTGSELEDRDLIPGRKRVNYPLVPRRNWIVRMENFLRVKRPRL